jgi:biotin synthase
MKQITRSQINEWYTLPLFQLVDQARAKHKENFNDEIELCQLISVKTGGCPEDCGYCSQSNHHNSEIKLNALLPLAEVETMIIQAKEQGSKRVCLGAAYKKPGSSALKQVCEYVRLIKSHGLEACATLGSLDQEQAAILKEAGLDYYNHNIDTSPEYYPEVVTSRNFNERLDTISHIGTAGIKVCCGGILGLGESREDRISFINALVDLPYPPSSIPINTFVKTPGVRLQDVAPLDKLELIRVIATIRIIFPSTRIRLSAGRKQLSDLEQTLCFMAGANSIFSGDKLLTVSNNEPSADEQLLQALGLAKSA